MPIVQIDHVQLAIPPGGERVVDDEPLPGYARVYVSDPFGNRIELLEPNV